MSQLSLAMMGLLAAPASARRGKDVRSAVQKVPSIEDVVAKEGFVPAPAAG